MILFRQSAMLHHSKPSKTEGFIVFKRSLKGIFGVKENPVA